MHRIYIRRRSRAWRQHALGVLLMFAIVLVIVVPAVVVAFAVWGPRG